MINIGCKVCEKSHMNDFFCLEDAVLLFSERPAGYCLGFGDSGHARRDTVEAGKVTPFSLPLEGRETGERSNVVA